MSKRAFGKIARGLRDALAFVRGDQTKARVTVWHVDRDGRVRTRKYLPLYVAEFQFRHNNRSNPDMFGAAIAGC